MLKQLLPLVLFTFSTLLLNAQLVISEYYEVGGDKWLEIINVGTAPVTGTHYFCLFSNTKADSPSGQSPTSNTLLPATINPCEVLLYRNSNTDVPTYALPSGIISPTINFNGDDLVIISTTNDNTAWANRTDVIGDGTNWGADKAFVRNNNVPNVNFTLSDWTQFTNAAVDAATSGNDEYLGEHTCASGTPIFSISPVSKSLSEVAGTFTFNVFVSSTSDCTVDLAVIGGTATNGVDYTYSPSSITFTSGGATSIPVTITLINDTIDEGNENFTLQLQNPGGTDGCVIGTSDKLDFTIIDDDAPMPSQVILFPCEQGTPLLTDLVSTYGGQTTLGYNDNDGPSGMNARDTMYWVIDKIGNDLSTVYSGYTIQLDLSTSSDPSGDAFNKGVNAEHSYPQSKGASNEPERSDIHALYPCKSNVNSDRSNCPYGELDDDTETGFWYKENTILTTKPTADIDDYAEKDLAGFDCGSFEPRESRKGDVARSIFYFYTMYKASCDAADPNFFHNMKSTLLDWHYLDPVDNLEYQRTYAIAAYQGNVNPFVIDSTLARRAYFEADQNGTAPSEINTVVQVYTADAECTDSQGWTHYWKNAASAPVTAQDELLLSVKKGSSGVVISPSQVKIEILSGSTAIDLSAAPYAVHPTWDVMRRYFDVTPTTQPSMDVPVRFYYTTTDFNEVNAASTFVTGHSDMFVYKINGTDNPDPSTGHTGVTTAEYEQPLWTYNTFGSYHYAEFSVSSFSGGGMGGGGDAGAFPVELVDFTANVLRNDVVLSWATATETNNKGFEIERSLDSRNFESIAWVNGQGNSSDYKQYTYTDKRLPIGQTYYYRLKQKDFDETFNYSPIIAVELSDRNKLFTIRPNIIDKEEITINFSNDFASYVQQGAIIQVFDIVGNEVYRKMLKATRPNVPLQIEQLTGGYYYLKIQAGGFSGVEKFLKL